MNLAPDDDAPSCPMCGTLWDTYQCDRCGYDPVDGTMEYDEFEPDDDEWEADDWSDWDDEDEDYGDESFEEYGGGV